ncbi:MAG: hypothetical protein HQ538_06390 [Parcubacteria group bacterium]|nr:hypothetical protein [Parcubacteria group bacterium]
MPLFWGIVQNLPASLYHSLGKVISHHYYKAPVSRIFLAGDWDQGYIEVDRVRLEGIVPYFHGQGHSYSGLERKTPVGGFEFSLTYFEGTAIVAATNTEVAEVCRTSLRRVDCEIIESISE